MPLKMFEPRPEAPKSQIGNIIAVAAGKGGVGKSSVAVNLARALQKLGRTVGVLDVDIYGPSVRKMLPEDIGPKQDGQTLIPAICDGIKMMSMAYFRRDNEAAVVRAPIANGIVTQFIQNIAWGKLDDLIIDFPPGTGDVQLTISQQAKLTGAIMVTTPQEVALMDVRKAINMFDQVQIPILGIVENMSYFINPLNSEKLYLFGKEGGQRLADEIDVPLLGQIPIEPQLCQSGDTGKSLFKEKKNLLVVDAFMELAKNTLESIENLKEDDGAIFPRQMRQKDPYTMTIEWSDGIISDYRLSHLQRHCPCAKCVDDNTGERTLDPSTIDDNVKAKQVSGVGRYAIRVDFTSGCSTGLYEFSLLRALSGDSR